MPRTGPVSLADEGDDGEEDGELESCEWSEEDEDDAGSEASDDCDELLDHSEVEEEVDLLLASELLSLDDSLELLLASGLLDELDSELEELDELAQGPSVSPWSR